MSSTQRRPAKEAQRCQNDVEHKHNAHTHMFLFVFPMLSSRMPTAQDRQAPMRKPIMSDRGTSAHKRAERNESLPKEALEDKCASPMPKTQRLGGEGLRNAITTTVAYSKWLPHEGNAPTHALGATLRQESVPAPAAELVAVGRVEDLAPARGKTRWVWRELYRSPATR